MKILQEEEIGTHPNQRRMYQLIELQQQREYLFDITQKFQEKMKEIFDRRTKPHDFQLGDVVFLWDAPPEDKGKHGKFDHLWKGPYNL